ncbi:MAG: FYDLN acid domain-containing protein [Deltaproteobacteria bacterium]|nr:FYDLN acid domain-containing protein [Deltaproteobacteria bacterium]
MTELGNRHKCYKCGCKFYDLNKPSPICPRCDEDQSNEENKRILKRKRKRGLSRTKAEMRPVSEEQTDSVEDDDAEEYVLDVEDIVLEDNTEHSDID